MRLILYTIIAIYFFSSNILLLSQNKHKPQGAMRINLIVDASCAKCQFDKKSDKDCLLELKFIQKSTTLKEQQLMIMVMPMLAMVFVMWSEKRMLKALLMMVDFI